MVISIAIYAPIFSANMSVASDGRLKFRYVFAASVVLLDSNAERIRMVNE